MDILNYYKGLLSAKGHIDRRGLLTVLFGILLLLILCHYLIEIKFPATEDITSHLWATSITDTVLLLLITPTFIKRFRDLKLPVFLVLLYWIALPFTSKYMLILRDSVELNINLMLTTTIVVRIVAVLLLMVLAFWSSRE